MNLVMYQSSQSQASPLTVVANNTSRPSFIEANTVEVDLASLQQHHIIPVYRDNEPLISQAEFIEVAQSTVRKVFPAERILDPSIRVSHAVKGRVPDARNKPANQLEEWEKTLYFERMAFLIEVPSIRDEVGGESVSLVIGGIKAYNLDNLSSKSSGLQCFKIFIGFKVSVCTNLCVWTDGIQADLKVRSVQELKRAIEDLVSSYDAISSLQIMSILTQYALTEHQFAQLLGRCKMYHYLPSELKAQIPELQYGDTQLNAICRDYFKSRSFCRDEKGDINLWKVYNLFTEANKSSYIDTFADRAVNASTFVGGLAYDLKYGNANWFLG